MRPPKHKTLWQRRIELLESLNLDPLADEISREWFRGYLSLLACPTPSEREERSRLAKLHDEGKLNRIPADLRASGRRMKEVLIVLHKLLGGVHRKRISAADVAERGKKSSGWARRGLRELSAARLLLDEPPSGVPCRADNAGRLLGISWPNVLDFGMVQGIQRRILLEPEEEPGENGCAADVGTRSARPETSSGRQHPDAAFFTEQGGPPILSTPPAQSEQGGPPILSTPPAQEPRENAGETDIESENSIRFFKGSLKEVLSSSSARERDGERKKENFWKELKVRLERYGATTARTAIDAARERGWTVDQVRAFLDEAFARSIEEIYEWTPGLVAAHLRLFAPGTRPQPTKPNEAYNRAKRDRDLALSESRRAAQATIAATDLADDGAAIVELRLRFAPVVAALSQAERMALAECVLAHNPWLRRMLARGKNADMLEVRILRELERRASINANGE